MNTIKSDPRRLQRNALLSIAACALLLLPGCAKKIDPIFFPDLPAAPRVQLLKQFNSAGSLADNDFVQFLIGEDTTDQFSKAYGLAFHQGRLYIADSGKGNPGIAVVDFPHEKIERTSSGVSKPISLAVDSDGTLYVCDLSEDQIPGIVVYNKQLQFLRRISVNVANFRPASVLIVNERLYVADVLNNQIHVLDKQTGNLLQTFGKEDRLGWPADLSLTPDGNILVTETGAQSLRLYDQAGQVLARLGGPGDRAGTFSRPKATDVDRDGHIYAVDVAFQNVQILDMNGNALLYFGQRPGKPDSLIMPAGIAIGYDRMDIFQPYAEPGFTLEYVVAVSSQGGPPSGASKISLYGFGKLAGHDYATPAPPQE